MFFHRATLKDRFKNMFKDLQNSCEFEKKDKNCSLSGEGRLSNSE